MSVVAGSPFDPVEYEGKKLVPGQANNVFIFPGVGFGSVMIKAKTVTDDMFIAAAKGLADYVSKEQIEAGNIYPEINDLRNISATVSFLIHHDVSVC
jgi:malic enzyme